MPTRLRDGAARDPDHAVPANQGNRIEVRKPVVVVVAEAVVVEGATITKISINFSEL